MKILNSFIKAGISSFCRIIKHNKDVKKYVFSKVLRDEVVEFIENEYYSDYEHIKRSISFFKSTFTIENFVILDIGGAIGNTAKIFADSFPLNTVYVFEPIKESFDSLLKNTKDRSNIKAINKAAGNINKKELINIAKRITASSLYVLHADKTSNIFAENLKSIKTEEIYICRIDDELPNSTKIGIMKIDVQGFELEVLKGASRLLENTYIVLLEVNNHNGYIGSPKYFEIDQAMRDYGFIICDICPSTRDKGRLKEWDVIYVNKKYYEDWNN
jgi:FkbM family methyltransferase